MLNEQFIGNEELEAQLKDTQLQLDQIESLEGDSGLYHELKETLRDTISAILEALLIQKKNSLLANAVQEGPHPNEHEQYQLSESFKNDFLTPESLYSNRITYETEHNDNFYSPRNLYSFPRRNLNGSTTWHLGHITDHNFDNTSQKYSPDTLINLVYATPQLDRERPCRFIFSKKDCTFGQKCRFHHGHQVELKHIKLISWNTSENAKVGLKVMARYNDGLWYKASIQQKICLPIESDYKDDINAHHNSTLDDIQVFEVFFDPPYEHEHTVNIYSLLPILDSNGNALFNEIIPYNVMRSNEPTSSQTDSETEQSDSLNLVEENFKEFQRILSKTDDPDQFGSWIKSTNGFGLKMVLKMGYKYGNPLGAQDRPPELGPAIVSPLPVRILPPGRSLDYIKPETIKKRKRGSGKTKFLSKYGQDYTYSTCSTNSIGPFNLMNQGLMHGLGTIRDNAKKDNLKKISYNSHYLSELRKSKQSESQLRSRLFTCKEKLVDLKKDLKVAESHLDRHTSEPLKTVQCVATVYQQSCMDITSKINSLEDEIKVINEKLRASKSKKKLQTV